MKSNSQGSTCKLISFLYQIKKFLSLQLFVESCGMDLKTLIIQITLKSGENKGFGKKADSNMYKADSRNLINS